MLRTYAILALGVIAVSFASILIRLCDAPPLSIAAYRLALAAGFFLVAGLFQRKSTEATCWRQSDLLWAALSGTFLSIHFATWITSLQFTTVASSVVLVTTAPLFVALGSALLLKEPLSRLMWMGILVSVVGAVVVGGTDFGGGTDPLLGDALALAGAVAGAGYFLVGRRLRRRLGTFTYVRLVYSAAAVWLVLAALLTGSPILGFSARTYVLLFLIAFVPQVIGHTSFNWALRHVSAALVAVTILGEPVGASLLAHFLLDEPLTSPRIVGGLLILTGVGITLRGESAGSVPAAEVPEEVEAAASSSKG
jgi:drug/metabolite transporter (DMT)-like permease